MYDRDFMTTSLRSQTSFGARRRVLGCRGSGKEFGANNFYGGNAPSREWTNQTLVAAESSAWRGARLDGSPSRRRIARTGTVSCSTRPGPELSDNRHRTHAVIGTRDRHRARRAAADR